MSDPAWPGGAAGALSLTFDNFVASEVLERVIAELRSRDVAATLFVEGENAELHPDALGQLAAGGHEVGYHAWSHEDWASLSALQQEENLARGVAAFAELGIELEGLRPPGGRLGRDGMRTAREAGLRYASPAGEGAGTESGLALVPFQWRHVDASCMLPGLEAAREQISGSGEPVEPAAFLSFLGDELERLRADGGQMAIVLHLALIEWLGFERLAALLDRVADAARSGEVWVATCAEVAARVLGEPEAFEGATVLDPTTWTA